MKIVNEWINYLTMKNKSKNTTNGYLRDFEGFLLWLKQDKQLSEITLEDLKTLKIQDMDNYVSYLAREKQNGETTRARKINALKNFFKYLVRMDIIKEEDNATRKLETPKLPKREIKFLTQEDVQKVISNLRSCHRERDTAILMLLFTTGMRLSELTNIKIQDIKDNSVRIIGKGNKERIIPLNDDVILCIDKWLKIRPQINSNILFVTERLTPTTNPMVQWMVKQAFKNAGIKDAHTHTCRHSAATMMLKNGTNLKVIQDILGHASLATTGMYAHALDEQKRDAVNGLSFKF
jgi:integrase/recombinase XerD